MIRHFPRRTLFAASRAVAIAIVLCCCGEFAHSAFAADKPALSAARLKELASKAIRSGEIQFTPPHNAMNGDTMEVNDVFIFQLRDRDAEDPYVRIFLDQVEIDLRRQYLLQRQSSRQLMEPYYVKMEQIVGKKLAVVEDAKLSDDDRAAALEKLDGELMKTYEAGLQAVAISVGRARFAFMVGAADQSHDVKLVASEKATIDMVRQTTASLLKDAGRDEADFPWSSYQAGETARLLGDYYCRVRLNGKQTTLTKKVGEKTDQLDFPDP